MAFSSRVSAALSDIFLPAQSIYNDLDNPAREADDDDPVISRPPPESTLNGNLSPLAAAERSEMPDDDPFSSVTPSVLGPARSRGEDHELESPPHLNDSSTSIPDTEYRLNESAGAHESTRYDVESSHAPFQVDDEPAASTSRSASPTPPASVYLPATTSPPSAHGVQQSPISPSSSASRSRNSAGGGMSASRSAIGNRSLMGLMGGTRYDGPGFGFGGVGVGEEDEEEELADHARQDRDEQHNREPATGYDRPRIPFKASSS